MNLGLKKSERLKSRKLIEKLFSEGKTLKSYPIIMVYLESETPQENPLQITTSVSKRKFKRAVDRNRVKRQMREGYRKNKAVFLSNNEHDKCYIAMFIYVSNQHLETKQIDLKINTLLTRLKEAV